MNRIGHLRLIAAVVAVSCGVLVQSAFSSYGDNHYCESARFISCPDNSICHASAHCGISDYHKCTNGAERYATCQMFPGYTCLLSATGCKFENREFMCSSSKDTWSKPTCYDECGTALQ